MTKDLYKLLGVPPTAAQDEIKRSYIALAKKFHPDLNRVPGATSSFKEVAQAYEVPSEVTAEENL
ncbi:unnamed protein product [Discosporangium mesarthrocarpum]